MAVLQIWWGLPGVVRQEQNSLVPQWGLGTPGDERGAGISTLLGRSTAAAPALLGALSLMNKCHSQV